MKKTLLLVAALSFAVIGTVAVSSKAINNALAQVGTAKVASVNIEKALNELQERKEMQAKLEMMQNDVRAEAQKRDLAIKQLVERRNAELKPDSADYVRLTGELRQLSAELNTFQQLKNLELQGFLKSNLRAMADKINTAAAEIAKEQGIGLIVSEIFPQLPADLEPVPLEQVQGRISARTVLFVAPEADLTSLVITRLDANYKAGR